MAKSSTELTRELQGTRLRWSPGRQGWERSRPSALLPAVHPSPGASRPRPRPMHPASKATPSPAPASQLRAAAPGASSAAPPPPPHPVKTFLSQSRPCWSLVTGVVPSRSLGLTLRPTPKRGGVSPLRRVLVSPPGGARPTPGCTKGADPGPDRLWALHPPSPGPAPELAPESPLAA